MNEAEYLVGRRLRAYRKKARLSEVEMGKQLNISQSTYSKMENSSRNISSEMLMSLQKMGVDIDFLITGEEKKVYKNAVTNIFEKCTPEEEKRISKAVVWMIEQAAGDKATEIIELNLLKDYLDNGDKKDYSVIASLRKIWDVNQEEMSDATKLYIKKYRAIEKRRQNPDAYILNTIYQKYECKPSYIMDNAINQQQVLSELWNRYGLEEKPLYCEYLKRTVELLREK